VSSSAEGGADELEAGRTTLDSLLLDGEGGVENKAGDGAGQSDLLLDTEHHALVHLGHANEQSRSQSPDVVIKLADVLLSRRVSQRATPTPIPSKLALETYTLVETDGSTAGEHGSLRGALEDVGKRQVGKEDIIGRDGHHSLEHTGDGGDEVRVGDEHALGGRGGAGGIHENSQVVGLRKTKVDGRRLAGLLDVSESADFETRLGGEGLLLVVKLADHDDSLEGRAFLDEGSDVLDQVRGGDNDLHPNKSRMSSFFTPPRP